jgi:hypothetical protein
MAATLFSPLSVQAVGSDVSEEAEILNAHGIMLGSGGDLRLQDDFTVEQLLTVLARLQGKDAEAKAYPTTNNFKDVPATRWSAPYTAWAKATGLSQGKPDGTIGFDEKVTAQRLAAFLLRAMGYTDVPYADTMSRAAELGFVSATQDGGESLLRGPVAKIVYDATQVEGKDRISLAERIGITLKDTASFKTIPSPVPFEDFAKDTNLSIRVSFTEFMGSPDNGAYNGSHVLVVRDEDIPPELPADLVFGFGGIGAASNAFYDWMMAENYEQSDSDWNDMRNGRGALYETTVVTIVSPSQEKMWYGTFIDNLKEGDIMLRLRELDCATYGNNYRTRSEAILKMKDTVSAVTINEQGILTFDAAKWSVQPDYYVGFQFPANNFMSLEQLAFSEPYIQMYNGFSNFHTIRSGQSISDMKLDPSYPTLLVYVSASHRIVGYHYLTTDEMAIARKLQLP